VETSASVLNPLDGATQLLVGSTYSSKIWMGARIL